MRELMDLPANKAMRELMDSPANKAMRELMDSPANKAMRELMDSPVNKATRELMDSPANKAMCALRGPVGSGIGAETINAYGKFAATGAILGSLADQFSEVGKRHSLLDKNVLASLTGPLAEAARANQWATRLAGTGVMEFAVWSPIMEEVERIHGAATSMLDASAEVDRLRLTATLGLEARRSAEMEVTRLKLSALAGAGDVLGFEARTSFAAYEQLFGDWHTRPDLPQRFWRDPAMRRRRYREADVDPGLIEAAPATAVEVVIDSGFAAGVSEGSVSVALFDIAGLSMQIRSNNSSVDAFSAIVVFEQTLRQFIAFKLEAVAGPQWFKQRVGGDTRKKARENRAAAMANGELEKALIAFLDLGDLIAILLRKDNWAGAFGYVFPNREQLEFDLRALVASRRPTMHARSVDAVRLVELMCIIRRLTQWIEGDGEWKRVAESED
jgi:hypothetical protein